MKKIWDKLPQPFFVLAPMYDVTDSAFRQVISRRGRPDLFFTEFVSSDGLKSVGREKILRELYVSENERSVVAQVFGAQPEKIEEAGRLIADLGRFVGIDINMGCPEKNVIKQGSCAALMKNPKLAQEIILAAKQGARSLPVSVKTRIGFSKTGELEEWTKALIESRPAAITFHLRTKVEESKVPAHWELVKIPVEMIAGTGIKIIGNGDVRDLNEARSKAAKYGLDGIMLGRAVFGNPWLFTDYRPTVKEKLQAAIEHTKIFADLYLPGLTNKKLFNGHTKNFDVMKKHYKAYVAGFAGAATLRQKVMKCENPGDFEKIVEHYLKSDRFR